MSYLVLLLCLVYIKSLQFDCETCNSAYATRVRIRSWNQPVLNKVVFAQVNTLSLSKVRTLDRYSPSTLSNTITTAPRRPFFLVAGGMVVHDNDDVDDDDDDAAKFMFFFLFCEGYKRQTDLGD